MIGTLFFDVKYKRFLLWQTMFRKNMPVHLVKHARVISDFVLQQKQFKCSTCGKSYTHKKDLNVHVKAVWYQGMKYTCPKCENSFASQRSVDRHFLNKHEDKVFAWSLWKSVHYQAKHEAAQ